MQESLEEAYLKAAIATTAALYLQTTKTEAANRCLIKVQEIWRLQEKEEVTDGNVSDSGNTS